MNKNQAFCIVSILQDDKALDEAHDVELYGHLAFVPGKGGSIAIIDIEDPVKPELVWYRYDPDGLWESETVLLCEDRLYLGTNDFHSVDISNPSKPKFDARISDPSKINRINGMAKQGSFVFAACKDGWINAFDVSNPLEPIHKVAFEVREQYDLKLPHDLDLMGPYLIAVDPRGFGLEDEGKLAVLRVFDDVGELLAVDEWALVGVVASHELRGANRVQVKDQCAFVGGSLSPKFSKGVQSPKGVVVDLTEPDRPTQKTSVNFPDVRGPNGLFVSGNVWFLAGGQTVEAYDIRDPNHPVCLASFTSQEAFPTADDNAHDLVYRDGYLYVSSQGDNAFVILGVEDKKIRDLAEGLDFEDV